MNILENNSASLNEIIFENRNKSYGAFVIRSNYDHTLLKSLGIMVTIFMSVISIALVLNNTTPEEKILDTGTNIPIPEKLYKVELDITPLKKTETVLPKQQSTSLLKTIAVSTNLKDHPIEKEKEITQTLDSPNNSEGKTNNSTGTDGKADGAKDPGEGTGSSENIKPAEPIMAPDVLPSFNLGPFLQKNLRYPEMAKEAGISGKVIVNFIIDEEGNILKATILKGIGAGCDEEALRVIKLMPKWTPGMNNGKPVKVSFNQVIVFRLQ